MSDDPYEDAADAAREEWGREEERERIAWALEAQILLLRAVPDDVTTVPRDAVAMDLQNLADEIRRGDA